MKKDLKLNIALSDKNKEIIRIAISVVIILVDIVLILGWQRRALANYFREGKEIKEAITALNNDVRSLSNFRQKIKDLDAKINNLKLSIVEEIDVPALVEDISNLANSCGVKVTQIKPLLEREKDERTMSTKNDTLGEIEIQIAARAGFHQLGNFVSKLESGSNFFRLSSLRIETDSKDYNTHNITFSLASVIKIKQSYDKKDSAKKTKR